MKIRPAGEAADGKTTAGRIIRDALAREGFDVTLVDEGMTLFGSSVEQQTQIEIMIDEWNAARASHEMPPVPGTFVEAIENAPDLRTLTGATIQLHADRPDGSTSEVRFPQHEPESDRAYEIRLVHDAAVAAFDSKQHDRPTVGMWIRAAGRVYINQPEKWLEALALESMIAWEALDSGRFGHVANVIPAELRELAQKIDETQTACKTADNFACMSKHAYNQALDAHNQAIDAYNEAREAFDRAVSDELFPKR